MAWSPRLLLTTTFVLLAVACSGCSKRGVQVTEVPPPATDDTTLGPGDVFGEQSFLSEQPRAADVVAQTDAEVLVLTPALFDKAIRRRPDVGIKVLSNLSVMLCEQLRSRQEALSMAS